jgi:DNA-binding PadR family transcriptional regulator
MYERTILLAFTRVHILHHAWHDPQGFYGAKMIQELKNHGYNLSPGTLYPLLHSMEKNKLLISRTQTMNGKQRKLYTITEKGKETLQHLKHFIKELSEEVM